MPKCTSLFCKLFDSLEGPPPSFQINAKSLTLSFDCPALAFYIGFKQLCEFYSQLYYMIELVMIPPLFPSQILQEHYPHCSSNTSWRIYIFHSIYVYIPLSLVDPVSMSMSMGVGVPSAGPCVTLHEKTYSFSREQLLTAAKVVKETYEPFSSPCSSFEQFAFWAGEVPIPQLV